MNETRIKQFLAHLRVEVERGRNPIQMEDWQTYDDCRYASNLDDLRDLHQCGNRACLGGYLALTPEFRNAGGMPHPEGFWPVFDGRHSSVAVAKYFGIRTELSQTLCTSYYADYPRLHQLVKGLAWKDWTVETLIDIFEAILDGRLS